MERCLYGPEGFYSSGTGIAGRGGDFITSPEVGPLFGVLLGRWLDGVWNEAGRPNPFPVLDVGTGPGTLLRGLKLAEPECSAAWDLIGIDRSVDSVKEDDGIRIQPEMPSSLDNSVVLANELLDNLPFRIVHRSSAGWSESFVSDGQFIEQPIDDPGLSIDPGTSAPLLRNAHDWVASILERKPLRLLSLDYGTATTAELAERGGWLRTYRSHSRGDDPLADPGAWDITTDVATDQLPGSPLVRVQSEFLHDLGIDELVAEGRARWTEKASAPDMDAFRMRSRIGEAEALVDPAGLGSWIVLEWRQMTPTTDPSVA